MKEQESRLVVYASQGELIGDRWVNKVILAGVNPEEELLPGIANEQIRKQLAFGMRSNTENMPDGVMASLLAGFDEDSKELHVYEKTDFSEEDLGQLKEKFDLLGTVVIGRNGKLIWQGE